MDALKGEEAAGTGSAGLLLEIGAGRLLVEGSADTILEAEPVKAEKAAHTRHA